MIRSRIYYAETVMPYPKQGRDLAKQRSRTVAVRHLLDVERTSSCDQIYGFRSGKIDALVAIGYVDEREVWLECVRDRLVGHIATVTRLADEQPFPGERWARSICFRPSISAAFRAVPTPDKSRPSTCPRSRIAGRTVPVAPPLRWRTMRSG